MNGLKNAGSRTSTCFQDPVFMEFTASLALTALILTPSTYLHEHAHALAVKILFSNSNPIPIVDFGGLTGSCTLGITERSMLTGIGKHFTKDTAYSLIYAAGPLAEIVSTLALSLLNRSGSMKLATIAFLLSLRPMGYALEDSFFILTGQECLNRDFCNIWKLSDFAAFASLSALAFASTLYLKHRWIKQLRLNHVN